jgi:hypothetical protein
MLLTSNQTKVLIDVERNLPLCDFSDPKKNRLSCKWKVETAGGQHSAELQNNLSHLIVFVSFIQLKGSVASKAHLPVYVLE